MKIAYADPPYIGCAGLYPEQTEVDHVDLVCKLNAEYDGWILHASATTESIGTLAPLARYYGARWCAWVKGFAAFKKNVSVAYAWEPVLIKAARKPVVSGRVVMRDWIQESITLQRGLVGAKPERVCHWAFELVGAEPNDELCDLFPGTGAVRRAWATWRQQLELPTADHLEAALRPVVSLVLHVEGTAEMSVNERVELHELLADASAVVDPEAHPELMARIEGVLHECERIGGCGAGGSLPSPHRPQGEEP